jgi:hypothetical protein
MPHAGCLLDSAWQDTILTHMEHLLQQAPSATTIPAAGAAAGAGGKGSGSKGLVSRAQAAAAAALKAAGALQAQRLVTRY